MIPILMFQGENQYFNTSQASFKNIRAIEAYKEKNFPLAIGLWKQIIVNQGGNPKVFFNIALAQAAEQRLSFAILSLERALAIDPEFNLGQKVLAELQNEYLPRELIPDHSVNLIDYLTFFHYGLSTNVTIWTAIALIFSGVGIMWIIALLQWKQAYLKTVIIIFLLSSIILGVSAVVKINGSDIEKKAVVMYNCDLLLRPEAGSRKLLAMPAGVTVNSINYYSVNDWSKVVTAKGENGFVSTKVLKHIYPFDD